MISEKRLRYIYCITNLVNGKNYYGQRTVSTKCKNLLSDLYWGSGSILKRAQRKYGLENFKKEIIISGNFTKDELNRFEKCIIRIQRLLGKAEYNIADGGDGWSEGMRESHWRSTHTKEFREKLSKIAKENAPDRREKAKKTIALRKENGWHGWSYQKELSDYHKKAISEAKKGKMKSSENPGFGKVWWTNGIENVKAETCPEGFWKGRYLGGKVKVRKERKRVLYRCIETDEVLLCKTWIQERGFTEDLPTSAKKGWANKGFHFEKVENF